MSKWFHGGAPGLREVLPRDITGATGPGNLDMPGATVNTEVLAIARGGDRAYLAHGPSAARLARAHASCWAAWALQPYGTVYDCEPAGAPERADSPQSWAVTSAAVRRVHAERVTAAEWPVLCAWYWRWIPGAIASWQQVSAQDARLALEALTARGIEQCRIRGTSRGPWLASAVRALQDR